jgi:hypothetical protein
VQSFTDYVIVLLTSGFVAALVGLYRARGQNKVDSASAWKMLLEQMQTRVLEQQAENEELKNELAERDGYIEKVIKIMHAKGIEVPTYVFRRRYQSKE